MDFLDEVALERKYDEIMDSVDDLVKSVADEAKFLKAVQEAIQNDSIDMFLEEAYAVVDSRRTTTYNHYSVEAGTVVVLS